MRFEQNNFSGIVNRKARICFRVEIDKTRANSVYHSKCFNKIVTDTPSFVKHSNQQSKKKKVLLKKYEIYLVFFQPINQNFSYFF